MKRSFIIGLAAAACCTFSCKRAVLPAEHTMNDISLEISGQEIVIVKLTNEKALTFEWNSASTELPVEYSLQYALSGEGNFAYKPLDNQKGNNLSFSFRELDQLREQLGLAEECDFNLDVYIEASTASIVMPKRSNLVTVSVIYNIPVPDPLELYGYGDAFSWGKSITDAEKLVTEDHNIFTWSGWLDSGSGKSFKFITNEAIKDDSLYPAYGRDERASDYWTLKEIIDQDDDQEFSVNESGYYDISLNIAEKSIKADYKGDGKLHLWGVGEGFDWGWKLDLSQEFATGDDIVYTWTGDARGKGFKLMLSNTSWDWGYNWDKASDGTIPQGEETEWTAILRENGGSVPDEYFSFPKDGNYSLEFNSKTLKLKMKYNGKRSDWEPEAYDMDGLWIYGPGIGNGKHTDQVKLTTSDNDTYIYTGPVKAQTEAFCLMCKEVAWWPRFCPDPDDSGRITYKKSNETYWPIDASGNYRITVIISELSITIELLED